MTFIRNAFYRVRFGQVCLTAVALLAYVWGTFFHPEAEGTRHRQRFSESLAITCSALETPGSNEPLQSVFRQIVSENPDILSLGVRSLSDANLLINQGGHDAHWTHDASAPWHVRVPLKDPAFALEVCYRPPTVPMPFFFSSRGRATITLTSLAALICAIYWYFIDCQGNPRHVIPERLQEALDGLTEGLLILDEDERILMANKSFQRVTGLSLERLLGKQAHDIPFAPRDEQQDFAAPWDTTLTQGIAVRGRLMGFEPEVNGASTTFSVSCSPILDDHGNSRGAIASFEDVTQLEQIVHRLNQSTAEIKRQNRELEILATRDSLTGCCNRRYFFQEFDLRWDLAKQANEPLSTLMVDIDHFKSINDGYGHALGDKVLRAVGHTLDAIARPDDIVSRYGGEEFAVLLPSTTLDDATAFAEKIKNSLASLQFSELSMTASVGVSSNEQGAKSPQELLSQADKSLYVAKRSGRNQVVRWDAVPSGLELEEATVLRHKSRQKQSNIPFQAVMGLVAALAIRHQETANHARRVADLCVAVAEGLLPVRDCYLLEIAGLLHDMGKLGVPDAMLTKTELSADEQIIARHYDHVGISMVDATFGCRPLTQIISNRTRRYDSDRNEVNHRVSIAARILTIADTYDNRIGNRTNPDSQTQSEAFARLRQGAGTEFDPELVDRFIYVASHGKEHVVSQISGISKDAALTIGLQMERLVDALDARDSQRIVSIAKHIQTTTDASDGEIFEKATQVASYPDGDGASSAILQTANELLDLCRLAQRSLWDVESENAVAS